MEFDERRVFLPSCSLLYFGASGRVFYFGVNARRKAYALSGNIEGTKKLELRTELKLGENL
jgi:hypothetical protein